MNSGEGILKEIEEARRALAALRSERYVSEGRSAGYKIALKMLNGADASGQARRKLEERVRREEDLTVDLAGKMAIQEGVIEALGESSKLIAKQPTPSAPPELRPGKMLYQVRAFIAEAKRPLEIKEILSRLEKTDTADTRSSIRGSVGKLARNNTIFVKTAPNTYGLVELGHKPETQQEADTDEALPPDVLECPDIT